ncbi:FAD/NAD(P)-binding domain-containing protein [Microthyrium microscopicum]|uniref:FAD/NAD(P)-binding domain-containing protein n=1 Tax=Microthyrium microscopicum TaxID=703497 RepID=A0A6A6U992_9PEZI|nr:FAD/NAD(P)-binding domain-containing protein [Microthyrium microscopicum]
MNGTIHASEVAAFDVIIIGAGISGINSAYRVSTKLPKGTTYVILEARNAVGGTWDFFRYPGIRSDSDLYTFGFAWRPWKGKAIAEGHLIREYLQESIKETGIDKNIKFNHKVVSADWSSEDLRWTLDVQVGEKMLQYRGQFMILGTGYYDYDEPLESFIPGIESFKGQVVHPQFFPEDLDYANKEVAIIGSGATAVTILPNMADKAKQVTMVQRSPSYIFPLPNKDDPLVKFTQWLLPAQWAHTLARWRWIFTSYAFFYFCRTFPNAARKIIRAATEKSLNKTFPHDPHFKPVYNPWEQRFCMAPDGDFYKAIRKGKASVVTGTIKTVTGDGITMDSGEEVKADILITATGLKIKLAGGLKPSIDGQPLDIPSKYMWKGVMLQDLPNACFVIGYTNASWTLGADATAQLFTRLINKMHQKGAGAVIPRLPNPEAMKPTPMLNLNSTYIVKAMDAMPKSGSEGNWRPRTNYFQDYKEAKWGDIESGMEFVKARKSIEINGGPNKYGYSDSPRI